MKTSKTKFSVKLPAVMLAVCACFLPPKTDAGVREDMAKMFNSAGLEHNYTRGGAYHGQAGGLYTGGSLSVRAPISDLKLGRIELPRINAGCGGIDLFGGSFSFVNKEQFIQFTRNLGNNAAGVAFELAINALDPMIGNAISTIRDLVDEVNGRNLNSCEAAKKMVGGIGEMMGMSMQHGCQASASSGGRASDASDARFHCRLGASIVDESNRIRGRNTPSHTLSETGGNLTYMALKKAYPQIKDPDLNLYMSLIGTIVFHPAQNADQNSVQTGAVYYPPTITDLNAFLDTKPTATGSKVVAGNSTPTIQVEMLVCTDGKFKLREDCKKQEQTFYSIKHDITEKMKGLAQAIRNNSGLGTNRDGIIHYINNTKLPILKIAISDGVMGSNWLMQPRTIEVIAVDYLQTIIGRIERQISNSMGSLPPLNEPGRLEQEKLINNLRDLRLKISVAREEKMASLEVQHNYEYAMRVLEQSWRTTFSDTNNSLAFDSTHRY